MKQQTINIQFNPSALPRWARKDGKVVALCERDLSFRCAVYVAKSNKSIQKFLKREAARLDRS